MNTNQLSDADKALMVSKVESLDELKDVIKKIAPVMGSRKSYDADKLISKVEQVEIFKVPTIMTRTYGLRAKLMELMFYKKHEI